MQSPTYKDIIDDKIAEWQQGLETLKTFIAKASAEQKSLLDAKVETLKATIDAAIVDLRKLDEAETAENTMETKDKILNIFKSIDKEFTEYQEKTPFML